ncbi:hypothetical protein ACB098_01G250800 [Castanea mollissima]
MELFLLMSEPVTAVVRTVELLLLLWRCYCCSMTCRAKLWSCYWFCVYCGLPCKLSLKAEKSMGPSQDQQNCKERTWHINFFFFFLVEVNVLKKKTQTAHTHTHTNCTS